MPCALCRQDRNLCRSHIIPQFLYAKMFEGGQKAHVLSTDGNVRPKKVPTGTYEKLLCQECENRLSVWENYAKRVIFGGEPIYGSEPTPFGLYFQGLDYRQFKLFQLSMLWRANVSKRPEFRHCNMSRGRRGQAGEGLIPKHGGYRHLKRFQLA